MLLKPPTVDTKVMPNFLVIGAPKSGTTSLYHYLKQHPQIYMSPVKEPSFFALDGEEVDLSRFDQKSLEYYNRKKRKSTTNIEDYSALFEGVTDEKAIGEASPMYIYSKWAPKRIHHYIPHAKLIAILRNPVDRAFSHYLMEARLGYEPIGCFTQAIEEEDIRVDNIYRGGRYYIRRGFYYPQLKRYFNLFDKSQLRIYLYDDFTNNPMNLLQDIFRFLEVDDTFEPDVSIRHNAGAGVPKNRLLHALLNATPNSVKPALKLMLPPTLLRWYRNMKYRNLVKRQYPPEARRKLFELYREDILQLQDLIQRDLSEWLKS